MMKPAPPESKPLTYSNTENDENASAERELANCARCGVKLLPDEEFYLHRLTGMAILCEKHYDKIRKVYNA